MGHLLHVKPFPSPPSSDLKLTKIKHIIHAFVLKHGGRLAVALGGAKSLFLDLVNNSVRLRNKIKRRKSNKRRLVGGSGGDGSVTMQLKLLLPTAVLSSSEVAVVQPYDAAEITYYDSSWNTMIPAEQLPPITGYLSWPEKEEDENQQEDEEGGKNEIDLLADKFIARCHERFMLEKQESYRRFQEMLARSL
ncbi:hypothetical protein GUJ93_ZPchr0002g24496 [Zizania palustris]|uniref:Uncharacterized protein n=1 Tax=Zizania palustris TaxID=103762 RepID=A0A8J5RTY2_ZIZPA|nr:hypothetical protein GUJ93_ZPchr0002g24496 [Zizania palustris]